MKYLASICLALLIIGLPLYCLAACGDQTKIPDLNDRRWVKSDKTIIFKDHGKLYKTQFNSNDSILLAERHFDYLPGDWSMSPDGRFILYDGYSKDNEDYSAYIFDLKRNDEFKLPVTLPYHKQKTPLPSPNFAFSADSKKLAWQEDQSFVGIKDFVVMNLVERTSTTIPFPAEASALHDYRDTEAKWALDGKSVFLSVVAYPLGAYYQFDIHAKKINKIDGRYHHVTNYSDPNDMADEGPHFIVNGKEVPFFKQPCLQWQCTEQGKAMHGETATIDKDYQLVLTTPDGKKTVLDKGEYNDCEGITIRILSWLENGKYLIYDVHGATYIYGVNEQRKAILKLGGPFGWADNENRKSMEF